MPYIHDDVKMYADRDFPGSIDRLVSISGGSTSFRKI
jgi:hypothetical protein